MSLCAHLNSIFTAHAFTTSYLRAAPEYPSAARLGLRPEQRQTIQHPDPQAAHSPPRHSKPYHDQLTRQLNDEIQILQHQFVHLEVQIEAVDDDLLQSAQLAIFEAETLADLEAELKKTKAHLNRISRSASRSKELLEHACTLLDEQAREKKRSLEVLQADADFARIRRDALVRRRDRSSRRLEGLRRERLRLREEEEQKELLEGNRREQMPSSSLPKHSPRPRQVPASSARDRLTAGPVEPRNEMARQQISGSGSPPVAQTSKKLAAAEPTTQPYSIPERASLQTCYQRGRGLPDGRKDVCPVEAQHQRSRRREGSSRPFQEFERRHRVQRQEQEVQDEVHARHAQRWFDEENQRLHVERQRLQMIYGV